VPLPNIFMPRNPPRRTEPTSPQLRTSMEERRRIEMEANPGEHHSESGFGAVQGIPLFTTWKSREECANARMHAPRTAGIWGGKKGAYSVVVSGGYEDDIDQGEFIKYTGTGGFGEDNQYGGGGNSWGKNVQTEDQTFGHRDNEALYMSFKNGTLVRVVRGERSGSIYSPRTGYRYDGLYRVTNAYMEKSKDSSYKICRFELRRLQGQEAIPKRLV